MNNKRKYIPISDAIAEARKYYGYNGGICALYDIEDMGFCKDGVTRWYHFTDLDGNPAYTLKR